MDAPHGKSHPTRKACFSFHLSPDLSLIAGVVAAFFFVNLLSFCINCYFFPFSLSTIPAASHLPCSSPSHPLRTFHLLVCLRLALPRPQSARPVSQRHVPYPPTRSMAQEEKLVQCWPAGPNDHQLRVSETTTPTRSRRSSARWHSRPRPRTSPGPARSSGSTPA